MQAHRICTCTRNCRITLHVHVHVYVDMHVHTMHIYIQHIHTYAYAYTHACCAYAYTHACLAAEVGGVHGLGAVAHGLGVVDELRVHRLEGLHALHPHLVPGRPPLCE